MMKLQEILQTLDAAGTAQNRKVYTNHGVITNQYGVSFAALGALQKKIKVDHSLAQQLWETGNQDARLLATMIADPKKLDRPTIQEWSGDLQNYILTDAFGKLLFKTGQARVWLECWLEDEDEWRRRTAWNLLGQMAMKDKMLEDDFFAPYLEKVASSIHSQKNRVREAMNNALIAIGIRNPVLEMQAMAVAAQVGVVQVDHGDTGCKTPDAASYIHKTIAHYAAQTARKVPA
jgi:3-methyladenine DNA glycosylase AlkD